MGWASYRDLIVWQKAMDLVDEVYPLSGLLPAEEKYALADQVRRASVSVPSNIAEGHGRQTNKEFKQFLSIARGSVFEVETQITIGLRQGFFTEDQTRTALSLCSETERILTRLLLTQSANGPSKN